VNNPPPVGKYVATGQGRVFIANLVGNPQEIACSGYEQILFGNPPECFPRFNRLRLQVGAESIAGVGVIQSGVVGFSQTGRMYMLRGQVEDITTSAPVVFTQYLEELPWGLGCMNHYSIAATPYGLVWLAGDKTVQFFDGRSKPTDISRPVYPLLQTITPGQESACIAAYFNWLERDWYCLLAPVGGSIAPNRIIFWSLSEDTGQTDIFVSDIQADWIGAYTSSKLQRQLLISQGGYIKQLPISADTVGGITRDETITPATSGKLNAYWRSGYFGNEQPYRSKAFRFGKLISDQDPSAFSATLRFVDDNGRTVRDPEIVGPKKLKKTRIPIGKRAHRCSVEINFPSEDASVNVTELAVASIGTSDR